MYKKRQTQNILLPEDVDVVDLNTGKKIKINMYTLYNKT